MESLEVELICKIGWVVLWMSACSAEQIAIQTTLPAGDADARSRLDTIDIRVWARSANACAALDRWLNTTCVATCPPVPDFSAEVGAPVSQGTLERRGESWTGFDVRDLPSDAVDVLAFGRDAAGVPFLFGCASGSTGSPAEVPLRRAWCDERACVDRQEQCAIRPLCVPAGEDWTRRVRLELANSTTEDFYNFPVPIVLHGTRIEYEQTVEGGRDLRFVADDDGLLSHEVEHWDESGSSLVWVRIPHLEPMEQQGLWMYFGNAGAPSADNVADTWAGYEAVYHFGESGASLSDSSGNQILALSAGPLPTSGPLGPARSFDGAGYIDTGAAINYAPEADFTWEAWFSAENGQGLETLMGAAQDQNTYHVRLALAVDYRSAKGATPAHYQACFCPRYPRTEIYQPTVIATGWHHVALVRHAGAALLYHDGSEIATDESLTDFMFTNTLLLGAEWSFTDTSMQTQFFHGAMDEVRISHVSRSGDFIRLQHLAMTDRWLRFGTVETGSFQP